MTPDDVDAAIALDEALAADARVASAPDGYTTSLAACSDLDEAERIRYLYVEREMVLKFLGSERFDPTVVPLLRATAHDEAIRQVAKVRSANGARPKVTWDDVVRNDT